MRRRINLVPPLIALAVFIAVAGGWELFTHTEATQYQQRSQVAHSKSDIRLSLEIDYDSGPLVLERYVMRNMNGVSTSQYRATSRKGTQITIDTTPQETYDVTFLFERCVADGIWKLTDKPPRGDTNAHYTLTVYQLVDGDSGSRTITFTDPHFWATTAGHEFHIHLDRSKPVPDLLTLQATAVQDPHYEQVVDEFRAFGTASFKSKVAQVRARLDRG